MSTLGIYNNYIYFQAWKTIILTWRVLPTPTYLQNNTTVSAIEIVVFLMSGDEVRESLELISSDWWELGTWLNVLHKESHVFASQKWQFRPKKGYGECCLQLISWRSILPWGNSLGRHIKWVQAKQKLTSSHVSPLLLGLTVGSIWWFLQPFSKCPVEKQILENVERKLLHVPVDCMQACEPQQELLAQYSINSQHNLKYMNL